MANITYTELLDEVLPELSADPSDPVTENAIRRAVTEFCADSWIWQYLPDPLDVTANEAAVDLEPPGGADITAVLHVALDGTPLDKRAAHWLDANLPRWRTDTATPRHYTQIDTDQIILAPVPASSGSGVLTMTLALQPSHTATGFPRWIFKLHEAALVDGAVSRLMLMADKPWSNAANGADRRARFHDAKANARAAVVMALGGAPLRTTSQH